MLAVRDAGGLRRNVLQGRPEVEAGHEGAGRPEEGSRLLALLECRLIEPGILDGDGGLAPAEVRRLGPDGGVAAVPRPNRLPEETRQQGGREPDEEPSLEAVKAGESVRVVGDPDGRGGRRGRSPDGRG